MENNKAIEILSKIVRKEPINQEEHSFINEWQNKNSINQQIYIFVTTKTSIDSLPDSRIDYQTIYNRIKESIDKNEQLSIEEPARSRRKTYLLSNLWKYAAVFFFGIISAATAMYLIPSGNSQAISEITVPKGSVSEIILPDSSIVTINSNSKLSYANDFLTGKRVVNLEGEAFFKVKKQLNGNEFTVCSKGTSIVVKGTEFNVQAYQDTPSIEATLVKGSIIFCADKKSIPLKPNQQLTYDTGNQKAVVRQVNVADTEWRNGKYTFREISLKEIVPIFNRIYNTNIVIDKATEDIVFSGYIDRKNPMTHSLDVILLTTGTHYQIINDTIYIKQ